MTLNPPRSGPQLEDILNQVIAYRQRQGAVWTDKGVYEGARELYNLLRRLAHTNKLTSRSDVAEALGHPFEPHRTQAFKDQAVLEKIIAYKQRPGAMWTNKAVKQADRALYNAMLGWAEAHGRTPVANNAAKALGHPFGFHKHVRRKTREQLLEDIAAYRKIPGAEWRNGAVFTRARQLYSDLHAFAYANKLSQSCAGAVRELGVPFERPKRTYVPKYTPPKWLLGITYGQDVITVRPSRKTPEDTTVLNLRGRGPRGRRDFGWYDLVPEKSYAWLEAAFDKLWVLSEFGRVHALDTETGQRAYLQPSDVKKKYRGLVATAIRQFGSYKKAMESWDPGSYLASLGRYTRAEIGDDALELIARAALQPLFARDGYVSRERLRIVYPNAFHPVDSLRKRKYEDARKANGKEAEFGYQELYSLLGVSPTELTPEQKKQMGWCGEAFSLAYFALAERAGAEEITEMHPRNLDEGKLEFLASRAEKSVILPDFTRGNGQEIKMTEIKAGDAFPYATAERILEKYAGEFSVEGEAVPVRFAEVHLHLPKKHIEQGVITVENGAQYLLDRKDVKVLTAEDIAQRFVDYGAPDELHNLYGAFALRPVKFILASENRANLASIVDAVLPEHWKQSPSFE